MYQLGKYRKAGTFKKDVENAQLKAESAQLRTENANLKQVYGPSKPLVDYRSKLYNEMMDTLFALIKENRKEIHRHDIMLPSHDICFNPTIRELRVFKRRFMTRSNNLKNSRYPKKWDRAAHEAPRRKLSVINDKKFD